MKYLVKPEEGWTMFGPREKQACLRYMRQAYARGTKVGTLRIVPMED